jgi:thioredoxin reductase
VAPRRFLDQGRRDARRYGVEFRRAVVTRARAVRGGFAVRAGRRFTSRVLLLATGVVDELPAIANLRAFYGRGVHHCPYCDGWEYRDKPLAAYGPGRQGLGLALSLRTWSRNVTVITNGVAAEGAVCRTAARYGINMRTEVIDRFVSRRGARRASRSDRLGRIVFRSGPDLRLAALFFNTDQVQRSGLPARLGCRTTPEGGVLRDRRQRTGVPGLYLAGDASVDVQFVIVAAAEGAKAGLAMNRELQERDRAGAWASYSSSVRQMRRSVSPRGSMASTRTRRPSPTRMLASSRSGPSPARALNIAVVSGRARSSLGT